MRKQQKISNEPVTGKSGESTLTNGGAELRATFQKQDATTETTFLMERIVKRENVLKALTRVEKNKGAPGVDGMKTQELRNHLKTTWSELKAQLMNCSYRPEPVKRVIIPKANGAVRELGIPTVKDRFVQQMVLQVLEAVFDKGFSESSYGFRPKKSAHQAVLQAKSYIQAGRKYVVDIDLEKFFDRVNHDMLMSRVAKKIRDKRVLKLIRSFLNAGVMIDGCCVNSEEGTPQGGPLSPLLSNIMLDDLDKELERRGHKFCRYADDCNIYVKSQRAGERVLENITKFLERKLKLRVNKDKSAADLVSNRTILGFSIKTKEEPKIYISPKAIKRFKEKIRTLTNRTWSIEIAEKIRRINEYLNGWLQYYKLAETPTVFRDLFGWLCRRLRQCLLCLWRKPKTRLRNLVKAGLNKENARRIASSSKGTWRLSLTHQLHVAFGIAYWETQGLLDLRERYAYCRSCL